MVRLRSNQMNINEKRIKTKSLFTSFRIAHDSDLEWTFNRTVEIGPNDLSINASAMPVSWEKLATV